MRGQYNTSSAAQNTIFAGMLTAAWCAIDDGDMPAANAALIRAGGNLHMASDEQLERLARLSQFAREVAAAE